MPIDTNPSVFVWSVYD